MCPLFLDSHRVFLDLYHTVNVMENDDNHGRSDDGWMAAN